MTWRFQPALSCFEANRAGWEALHARCGGHVLLDFLFVSSLLKYFGNENVLLGTFGEEPSAMALVERKSNGIWETFHPSQAPLGLFLAGPASSSAAILRDLIKSLPGFALQVSLLHMDPDHFSPELANHSSQFEKVDYIKSARILLSGTFEEYWQTREGRLRKNNDRLRRRMAEKELHLEFVVVNTPAGVADAVREYGRLESKGWKGAAGTAVSLDNVQGQFYRELLEGFCSRGEGAIYQLKINGQVVASDICVFRSGTLVLLKTAYDEEFSVYSPAFLMREDAVKHIYSEGLVRNYEFYGPLMDYQLRWTDQVRTLYHLNCFRYGWLPAVKNVIKRFRGQDGN